MHRSEMRWIRLDPSKLEKPERSIVGDHIEVQVFMSPYDVPEAVGGQYDAQIKRFVIEFKYLDDEKYNKVSQAEHLAVRIGKNSGRLLGIELDVDALKAQAVGLKIITPKVVERMAIEAVDHLAKSGNEPRMANYRIAREIIAGHGERLFDEALATTP